jgi:hypothetical protein
MHYSIAGISELAIYKILVDILNELINKNLLISQGPLPSYQIAKLNCENIDSSTETAILKLTKGLSKEGVNGRDLRRLPFKVFSSFAMRGTSSIHKINIKEFLEEANKLLSNQNIIATVV